MIDTQPAIKVLLVDDHPVVRTGLRALVEGFEGIQVVGEAADGAEALASVEAVHDKNVNDDNGIDVVVMDIQMPGLDGITTTARLQAQNGPPVLILTTYDTQADVVAAVEAGAKGYLLKDADPDKLRQAIVDTAAGKSTVSAEVAALLRQNDRENSPGAYLSKTGRDESNRSAQYGTRTTPHLGRHLNFFVIHYYYEQRNDQRKTSV